MKNTQYRFDLTVTSELPAEVGHIPMSVEIDFAEKIQQADADGVFDPNSILVINAHSGAIVPHARTEDFAYGDKGRIEWVITDPAYTQYEIWFGTTQKRPPLAPQAYVPMVGVGDLLRYNAGVPRPIVLPHSMKLVDFTGNGKADLVGCWNYYHRPGAPISGIVMYPRVGLEDAFTFGDMARLRYVEERESQVLHHFPGTYIQADFADVNGDGLVDILYADMRDEAVTVFLNTGACDEGGLPIFVKDIEIPAPVAQNAGICAVDLNGDGVLDLVVNGYFIQNKNANGWPFEASEPVDLNIGKRLTFLDMDGDGWLDVLGMPIGGCEHSLTWRRHPGDGSLTFGAEMPLPGIDLDSCSGVQAVQDGDRKGILVQHNMYQEITFCELVVREDGARSLVSRKRLESVSAVLALSDQAWPCLCDWDGDGVNDMVVGGGYGWPRVVINEGTTSKPAWALPDVILANEKPVRILRDDILGSKHWHNMGYSYPVFVDWDGDGLPDLMLPNETNRIVWHKNIGTREEPKFGSRQFLEVDGFADSEAFRWETGRKTMGLDAPTNPFDEHSPFHWRSGVAFADWNGDGIMDFIALDHRQKATLFLQYLDENGILRLKKGDHVRLVDGREIDDSIVGRTKHWTESFRAVDWDGDGLIDLVYNLAAIGKIFLLRNVGSKTEPLFDLPREFKCYGEEIAYTVHGPNTWPADWNGDGKPDLVGAVEWSVYPFYAYAALEMDKHPEYQLGKVNRYQA